MGRFSFKLPSLYFRSVVLLKLLSSFIHHTNCREGFEPLSRRSRGWKRMGFLLMFKRWSASVFVAVFLFIFSNPLRSLLFLVCSLCLTPTPLLLGKAYSCVYYCLFTITMSEWVTVDDHWRSKCLSGSRRRQIKTRDGCKYTDWHMGDSQRKVTTELRGTRERVHGRKSKRLRKGAILRC